MTKAPGSPGGLWWDVDAGNRPCRPYRGGMVKHLLSVTTWGRLPQTPSDEQLLEVARATLDAADAQMMDKAKAHPLVEVAPVTYTLAIILGTMATCRDEPHDGIPVVDLDDVEASGVHAQGADREEEVQDGGDDGDDDR